MARSLNYIVFIMLFLSACSNSKQSKKKNDYKFYQKELRELLKDTTIPHMILVNSAQFEPYKKVVIDSCEFNLALKISDTIYLSTTDRHFTTPEGYKVGMKYSELPKELINKIFKEPGWGYYIKLPSKWALGFCEGKSCTDTYPGSSSYVGWIFKRH